MRALMWDDELHLVEIPAPPLTPGEAIIRPLLAGICATDIHITHGYAGYRGVLGHEFVGVVEACDDAAWIGRRVVGEMNAACRTCPTCLAGDDPHCPNRTTLGMDRRNGVMADRFALPVVNLHAVPDGVPNEAAVFTEPLAAALEIVEQSHIKPSQRVSVVGDGKLGLLIAQVLRLTGCDLRVVGRHPERWALLEKQGIAASTPADAESDGTHSWDVVIDVTGSPSGLATALLLLRPRGRLILKSTFPDASPINLSALVVDEITLVGSRCGPFAAALRLLQRGLIDTESMRAQTYPLSHAVEAFGAAAGRLKVLLEP
jgi:alcohol dehydrogenase